MSNGLDPDQDQDYVSPGLGPNCLPGLSSVISRQCPDTKANSEDLDETGVSIVCLEKRILLYRNILNFKKFKL